MMTYLAIAIGGALGAVSRYWLSSSVQSITSSGFPMGTFTVNALGSFLIGLLFILFSERLQMAETLRPLLIVGFLGAMTTFSTFSLDALLLFQEGNYNTALFYILSSVVVCLFAAYIGILLAKAVF
ncbi:MAG: fluoride efflux transporter CrcB [Pseudomonadales bacterium]|nr:fluoride efflux transporter CrcB [Pseudomonadales bacterium]